MAGENIQTEDKAAKEVEPELSKDFLKKYVVYAKQRIYPKLSKDAEEEIKNYYIELRSGGRDSNKEYEPIPITPRQGESLIMISEAAAKIRISETIDKIDVERGKTILNFCLNEFSNKIKQPLQEQNIMLATGGESSLSSQP